MSSLVIVAAPFLDIVWKNRHSGDNRTPATATDVSYELYNEIGLNKNIKNSNNCRPNSLSLISIVGTTGRRQLRGVH